MLAFLTRKDHLEANDQISFIAEVKTHLPQWQGEHSIQEEQCTELRLLNQRNPSPHCVWRLA